MKKRKKIFLKIEAQSNITQSYSWFCDYFVDALIDDFWMYEKKITQGSIYYFALGKVALDTKANIIASSSPAQLHC